MADTPTNEKSSHELVLQQSGERLAAAELELAYAASSSQDVAVAQETQAIEGDGLSRDDWYGSYGMGSKLVEIGRSLAGVELDLRRDPSPVRAAGFDAAGRLTS